MSKFASLRFILAEEGLTRASSLDLDSQNGRDFLVKAMEDKDVDALFGVLQDDPNWDMTLDDMRGRWLQDLGLSWEDRKPIIAELDKRLSKFFSDKAEKEISADPDKKFLRVLAALFTTRIVPKELPLVAYKEYKNYVRLVHPGGDWIPEGNVTWRDLPRWMKQNGITFKDPQEARALFTDFLHRRAKGGSRRPPARRPTPPLYD